MNDEQLLKIKNDNRYTYSSEYFRQQGRRRVARFNSELIGQYDTLEEALQACLVFEESRRSGNML